MEYPLEYGVRSKYGVQYRQVTVYIICPLYGAHRKLCTGEVKYRSNTECRRDSLVSERGYRGEHEHVHKTAFYSSVAPGRQGVHTVTAYSVLMLLPLSQFRRSHTLAADTY